MRARYVLTAILAVTVLLPNLGVAQYAPKWHVGDWWVVKTWDLSSLYGISKWKYTRYDVVGVQKVGNRACYVLEAYPVQPGGVPPKTKDVFYVLRDDWLVVRRTTTSTKSGRLRPLQTTDYPLGQRGPCRGGLHLPRFPLRLGDSDTTPRLVRFGNYSARLREMSDTADSSLVNRLLSECDSAGGRVLQPTGRVYQIRDDEDRILEPDEEGWNQARSVLGLRGDRSIVQGLQLWSEDLPWRVCEELFQYDGPNRFRTVLARSWLIAVGHNEK